MKWCEAHQEQTETKCPECDEPCSKQWSASPAGSTACIQFVLDILWAKNKDKPGSTSDYADAVIDFFGLDNRFYVNALIFKKEMSHKLPEYIQSQIGR